MTAPPELSQSSTPLCLLVPRHPPHALTSLATLFPPSVDVSILRCPHLSRETKNATLARCRISIGKVNDQFSSSKGSCSIIKISVISATTPCEQVRKRLSKKHQVVLDATSYPIRIVKDQLNVADILDQSPGPIFPGPSPRSRNVSYYVTYIYVITLSILVALPFHVNPRLRNFFLYFFIAVDLAALSGAPRAGAGQAFLPAILSGMEMRGIEPLTPCLQSRCSPS